MSPSQLGHFTGHLIELRSRLLKIVLSIITVFLMLVYWSADLYQLLALPLLKSLPLEGKMIAIDVITPFIVPIKVTLMVAFLITLPYIIYQLWAFIAPGLYYQERRFALPLIIITFFLFILGMLFAYFLVLPIIFHFISATAPTGIVVMTDIDHYLSFVLEIFLAFGLTFEMPIVVNLLIYFKIVSLQQINTARPYIIIAIFIIAAVITPPDVVSQIMLAIPLWLLFELGILLARRLIKIT